VACTKTLAQLPNARIITFVENPRVVRVLHRDERSDSVFQHVDGFRGRDERHRDADAQSWLRIDGNGHAHERKGNPAPFPQSELQHNADEHD
jgi:hypothetical protein